MWKPERCCVCELFNLTSLWSLSPHLPCSCGSLLALQKCFSSFALSILPSLAEGEKRVLLSWNWAGQMNASWFVLCWQVRGGGNAGCDPLVTVLLPSSEHCLWHFSVQLWPRLRWYIFLCPQKMCRNWAALDLKLFFFFSQLPWAKVLFKFRMLFLSSSSCTAAKNKELRRISPVWMPGAED